MSELAQTREQAQSPTAFSMTDLWMLLLVSIWGANFVALKFAVSDMGALGFGSLRFTLGTLIMLALWFVLARNTRTPSANSGRGTMPRTDAVLGIARRDWLAVVALGIVGNTGYQFFFISAIKYSTASNASLIVATAPSITPRRPTRSAMERTRSNVAIVPAAKIAYTRVTVRADR